MKKEYIKPVMNIVRVNGEMMLAASGVKSVNNGVNIGYGGVDEEGTVEAEVKGNPFGDSVFE
ncbi:MAG: hypothetical protein IJ754_05585 [Bacteroidaceae bacterium]|nr:hypothetical protein [Bacteroidaceae bacterium]